MKKSGFKKRLGRRLIAAGLLLAGLFIILDMQMRPIILKTSGYQCKLLATGIINNAVSGELESEMTDYSALITLRENTEGEIVSIESNVQNINRLKSRSTKIINDAIINIDAYDLGVPIGTISGISMLYGWGPQLPVRIKPRGYVNTRFVSKFTSAGINQTLHQIIMVVDVELSAIIPMYSQNVNITTEFLITETVIVGNVPNSYANIMLGG